MKITVTGSLGNISRFLVQRLTGAGHDVKVISSKAGRAKEIEDAGAEPAIGMVEDVGFLVEACSGADAVYTMVPPLEHAVDWKKEIARIGENYAAAIKESGVKRVVNLSSMGAHLPEGAGPVSGLYFVEQALNALEDVQVTHLRPGYFYYNFYSQIPLISNMNIMGSNFGAELRFPLVDVSEIAEVAFEELTKVFDVKPLRFIVSDVRTSQEIATVIGEEIGKPGLKWVKFPDEDFLDSMIKAGLDPEIAANYTEMGAALDSGRMSEGFDLNQPTGKKRVEDFAKEFAEAFKAGNS